MTSVRALVLYPGFRTALPCLHVSILAKREFVRRALYVLRERIMYYVPSISYHRVPPLCLGGTTNTGLVVSSSS